MIVVDTCIIIYLNQISPFSELAEAVYDKDPYWIYPSIWEDEYLNVLAKKARMENLPLQRAIEHFRDVKKCFQYNEKRIDKTLALQVAMECDITVYDAQFIALANHFSVSLITQDKELIKKCPHCVITMEQFLKA